MAEWQIAATARNDFADLLERLTDDQFAAQSLCEEWSVRDVAGHLVSLVEASMLTWVCLLYTSDAADE